MMIKSKSYPAAVNAHQQDKSNRNICSTHYCERLVLAINRFFLTFNVCLKWLSYFAICCHLCINMHSEKKFVSAKMKHLALMVSIFLPSVTVKYTTPFVCVHKYSSMNGNSISRKFQTTIHDINDISSTINKK